MTSGLVLLALFGCANQARSDSHMTSGFETALAAFHHYAATEYKVAAQKVSVGPSSEAVASKQKENVGHAWAFQASVPDRPGDWRRGWATPQGAVATPKQNLGVLFEEAKVWTSPPGLDADDLVERIIWAMGPQYQLFVSFRGNVLEPSLTMNPDGNGVMKFRVKAFSPPPGRPMEYVYDCTVTLTRDHHATLALSENLNK
jgi:hypothetical protein